MDGKGLMLVALALANFTQKSGGVDYKLTRTL
jgi:hypothetical protein